MARGSKYDKPLLAPIVASSRTLADVIRKLGLPVTGGNYRQISARLRVADVDTSHFRQRTHAARCNAVAPEVLTKLVASSKSFSQVLAELGLPTEGRAYYHMERRLRELAIDTSHFTGRAWNRGHTHETHESVARVRSKNRFPDEAVFVENSTIVKGRALIERLLALGWRYECAWCGISKWRDQDLVLHLDHINGIINDNRLENLRFLCPNCHTQTSTYCRRRPA